MINEDFKKALEVVSKRTGATRKEILGRNRKPRIVVPRQIVCWIMRNRGWDYASIGALMNSHHGTIIHSCKVINTYIAMEEKFRKVWPELDGRAIAFGDSETRKENKRKLQEMVGA